MFTIRGKLIVYALEIVAAVILLLSVPPWESWAIQLGLFALAVFAVVLATALGRSIASGVDRLVVATRQIGEGDYENPVQVGSGDEIAALGDEIDRMRVLLREKVRLLQELAHDLESLVDERTRELRRANERLAVIHEVTNRLNSSLDFQRIFEAVVTGTRRLVDFDQASITKIVDEATAIVYASAPELDGAGLPVELATSRFSEVVRTRKPQIFDVPLPSPQDTPRMSWIVREVVLPLVSSDAVVGTFNLGSRRRDAFRPEEIDDLEQIAAELAVALAQSAAYEREHKALLKEQELSELKSDFVSKVSHELRTPLTTILGAIDNLLDGIVGPVAGKPREYLARMKENGDRLLRLINDLLDLSRIEAGREELRAARFSLQALIAETVDGLRPLAEIRGVRLETAELPTISIVADRDKIGRVLLNLVQNAIKFTDAGGRILLDGTTHDGLVRVSVRDDGVGIPAHELERIFDKFHQVRRTRDATSPGTGLGLPISRQLVEMHGGHLVAESRLGAGSTFTMTLPLGSPPRAAGLAAIGQTTPWPGS